MRLVQVTHPSEGRRAALVEENQLRLLRTHASLYACAAAAIMEETSLADCVNADLSGEFLDYDPIYEGQSEWRLLPSFDFPEEPARCLVSGTGLTHKKSAANRDAMHSGGAAQTAHVTDSMRIYQWGAEGGRPNPGVIGVQPEWFYKGCGTILRAHREALEVPPFADDGGEEPEIAGVYVISEAGEPIRVGFTAGNEFSDHQMERKNYLYLAPSKIRTCSIGPELVAGGAFEDVHGTARVSRGADTLWSQKIATGEANMVHSLENLEHHLFKYPAHRRPGDVHVHFFGADAFSFGDGIALEDGDLMEVHWDGYGRPLRNPIRVVQDAPQLIRVKVL